MQTIFVTGADGFAGAAFTQHLRQRGFTVVAGVRNRARKLAYEKHHGKALVCDVADPIAVARAVASVMPDSVAHLAGPAQPLVAANEPLQAYQAIVSGWANVLDAVRRSVPRARVLLVSACDVYGRGACGGGAVTEDSDLAPVSTFGSFKQTAEAVAHTFYEQYHLNLTIARPFHYAGPGQPDRFFYGAIARRLAEWDTDSDGDELRVPDLSFRRDLLHVDDVAEAYERLLREGQPDAVYNVCSGETRSCREIVEAMIQASRLPIRVVEEPVEDDSEAVSVFWGRNEKIRAQTGWQPTHTVDGALQALVRSCERSRVLQGQ